MPAIFSPRLRLPIDLFVSSQQSSPNVHNLNLGTDWENQNCASLLEFLSLFFGSRQTRTHNLWFRPSTLSQGLRCTTSAGTMSAVHHLNVRIYTTCKVLHCNTGNRH